MVKRMIGASNLPGCLLRAVALVVALIASSAVALPAQTNPCDPRDDYDEYLHYRVTYLGIGIGSFEFYFSENGACPVTDGESVGYGLNVMETFPGIGFLRVYTEYFSRLDADGYFTVAHAWDEKRNEWEFAVASRDYASNSVELQTGRADDQFGEPTEVEAHETVWPGMPTHDAISLIRTIRKRIPGEDRFAPALYHEGEVEPVPVTVISRDEEIEVRAFEEPQSSTEVEVELDFEGIHGLRDALTVHFANDAERTPLHARARVAIGSVRLELVEYER